MTTHADPTGAGSDAAWQRVTEKLEQWREALALPYMGLALAQRGEQPRFFLAGQRDLESGSPFDQQTLFPIGSLSKGFTAVLAAMQVRAGKLQWQAPLLQQLSGLRFSDLGLGTRLLVRDLFCHRSTFGNCDLLLKGRLSREQIFAHLAKAESFDPAQGFLYSNINYYLAGELLSSCSGRSWSELLQQDLLTPLGMTSSNASSDEFLNHSNRAQGYWQPLGPDGPFQAAPFLPFDTAAAAGGIHSTLEDMARWLHFLLEPDQTGAKDSVAQADLETLWQPILPVSPGVRYGLGFKVGGHRGLRSIFHEGNLPGFASSLSVLPELGCGCVLFLGSSESALQSRIYEELWDAWFASAPDKPALISTMPGPAAQADLDHAPMHFRTGDSSLMCTMFRSGQRLNLDVPGQPLIRLEGPSQARVYLSERDLQLGPVLLRPPEASEPQGMLLLHYLEFDALREGPDSRPPTADDLATVRATSEMTGEYHIHQAEQRVQVQLNGEKLTVDVPNDAVYELSDPLDIGRWMLEPTRLQSLEFHGGPGRPARAMTWRVAQPVELVRADREPPAVSREQLLQLRHGAEGKLMEQADRCLMIEGRVHYVHQGLQGELRSWHAGMDRARYEETLDDQQGALSLVVDQRAWKRDLGRGGVARELDDHELALALEELAVEAGCAGCASAAPALKHFQPLSEEEIQGSKCVRVWVQPQQGLPLTHWICVQSGKILQTVRGLETTVYEDFRDVDGIQVPFRRTTTAPPPLAGKRVVEVSSAQVLTSAPETVFSATR